MFDCFGLDNEQSNLLVGMLSDGKDTATILKKIGIPNEQEIDSRDNRDAWLKSLKFRRHVNEILTLSTEPDLDLNRVSFELKNNTLTLEEYSQTNFSEADYTLFLTLAYGPLLE